MLAKDGEISNMESNDEEAENSVQSNSSGDRYGNTEANHNRNEVARNENINEQSDGKGNIYVNNQIESEWQMSYNISIATSHESFILESEINEQLINEQFPIVNEQLINEQLTVVNGQLINEQFPIVNEQLINEQLTVVNEQLINEQFPIVNEQLINEQLTVVNEQLINEQFPIVNEQLINSQLTVVNEQLINEQFPKVNEQLINSQLTVVNEKLINEQFPIVNEQLIDLQLRQPVVKKLSPFANDVDKQLDEQIITQFEDYVTDTASFIRICGNFTCIMNYLDNITPEAKNKSSDSNDSNWLDKHKFALSTCAYRSTYKSATSHLPCCQAPLEIKSDSANFVSATNYSSNSSNEETSAATPGFVANNIAFNGEISANSNINCTELMNCHIINPDSEPAYETVITVDNKTSKDDRSSSFGNMHYDCANCGPNVNNNSHSSDISNNYQTNSNYTSQNSDSNSNNINNFTKQRKIVSWHSNVQPRLELNNAITPFHYNQLECSNYSSITQQFQRTDVHCNSNHVTNDNGGIVSQTIYDKCDNNNEIKELKSDIQENSHDILENSSDIYGHNMNMFQGIYKNIVHA